MTAGMGQSFTYDGANRLKTAGNGNSSFGYDGDGTRVKKTENGANTFYVKSSVLGQTAMEVNSTGVMRAFVYSGNKLVAMQGTDGQFYWLHTNHLGNARTMTDANGNVAYGGQFDPYGQTLAEWSATGNTTLNTKKFTGYERDAATGLDYAQARMYNSSRGRFMTPDPIGFKAANPEQPKTLNRYNYVGNDPVNHYDPSGLLTIIIGGTIFLGPSAADWAQEGTEFHSAVSETFGEIARVLTWSGDAKESARMDATSRLLQIIKEHQFKDGEKLNIVAHSHGGNIAKLYTWLYEARKIDVLVTLKTPQNGTSINMERVSTYLNVYSKHDKIQKLGTFDPSFYVAAPYLLLGVPFFGGRTDGCAINIGVDNAAKRASTRTGQNIHSALHTPEVWRDMLAWLGRAGLSIHQPNVNGFLNSGNGCKTGPGYAAPQQRPCEFTRIGCLPGDE